jgi:hypothetical protein
MERGAFLKLDQMNKNYYLIGIIFLLFNVLTILAFMPHESRFAKSADEGYYLSYSERLMKTGLTSYPAIFNDHVKNTNNWIWPSPLRVGYFLISSCWLKVFGPSFRTLGLLSFVSFIFALLVNFYYSKKYFGEKIALFFTMLLSFSPIMMAMAKRALSDSLGNLFILFSFWLFLDFLSEKRKSKFVFFIVCFFYSILVREQSVLFLAFFITFFIFYKYRYDGALHIKYLFLIAAAPVSLVGLTWLFSSLSLHNLTSLIVINRSLPSINEYSVFFCRGAWFRYIVDFICLSPVTTMLALVFIVNAFVEKDTFKDYKKAFFLFLVLVVFTVLSSFDYNKNVRYVMSLDMPLRLFAVLSLSSIANRLRVSEAVLFIMVLFLCILDYGNFLYLFCERNIYDPISYHLMVARRFIP